MSVPLGWQESNAALVWRRPSPCSKKLAAFEKADCTQSPALQRDPGKIAGISNSSSSTRVKGREVPHTPTVRSLRDASTQFSPESGGAAAIKSLAYRDEVNKETEPPDRATRLDANVASRSRLGGPTF